MTSPNPTQPLKVFRRDHLMVEVHVSPQDLGQAAGAACLNRLRVLLENQIKVNVVFAAAPSQNEFLETLSSAPGVDWSRVTAMHVDEHVGLADDAPQCFGNYLRQHIFDLVEPGQVHFLDGTAADLQKEVERYSALLRDNPVDVVCAGIGENGHLAFNDPGVADFLDTAWVKIVELDRVCRQQQVNDGCFVSIDDVPSHALTLTIPALMAARWIYCMVPGHTKAEAVRLTLGSEISDQVPATALRVHPRAVLYVDIESSAHIKGD